jgi:predicted aspartyl protease
MTISFDAKQGLIVVPTRLYGPTGDTVARLALDTGATRTMISPAILISIGYDPAAVTERVRITTGSGVEFVVSLPIGRIEAAGCLQTSFPVVCHTLPPSASVDGVLGLDFLRGRQMSIDFVAGRLSLQ